MDKRPWQTPPQCPLCFCGAALAPISFHLAKRQTI